MPEYDNNNRGVLFPNKRKTTPSQPDFTGNVVLGKDLISFLTREMAAGREPKLEMVAWSKTSGAGNRFLSLSVKEPYDAKKAQGSSPAPSGQSGSTYDINDDIPF